MGVNRRTIQEQLGVAFHASALRIETRSAGDGETSLLRVAALGSAQLHIQHGADRGGRDGGVRPIAEVLANPNHQPKPQDVIAGELAGLLWHLRYGAQLAYVHQAVALFAAWLSLQGRFEVFARRSPAQAEELKALLPKFAERALREWLSDRCIACGGTGKLERAPSGSWVRPMGNMKRNATFRVCTSCHGSRRSMPSHTARRMAMGIDIRRYEAEGWARHFSAAQTWLRVALGRRLRRPLTAQLERSTKRD